MEWSLWGAGAYLLIAGICDIRTKRIPEKLIVLFLIPGVLHFVVETEKIIYLLGILPGIGILLFGRFTEESVGYGDGLSILLIGIYLGIRAVIFISVWAMFTAGIYGAGVLVLKKGSKNKTFPFLPFLCFSFICWLLCQKGGIV